MVYTPTEWATGDVITAQKLNKIEQGIAGAGLQLYGPYNAFGSATVPAGDIVNATCSSLEDAHGVSVKYPEAAGGAITFVATAGPDDLVMTGFAVPLINTDANGDLVWYPGRMSVYNNTQNSAETECTITFYSTVEFPQES